MTNEKKQQIIELLKDKEVADSIGVMSEGLVKLFESIPADEPEEKKPYDPGFWAPTADERYYKTPCTYVSGNARAWLDIIETLDDINLACRIPQGILDVLNKHESIFADIVDVEGAANCFARQVFPEELPENVRERHTTATFLITCDRGISHELVRHRAASFSQQSTRYCKANKNGEIEVIKPSELKIPDEDFMKSVSDVDEYYEGLTECAKIPPQTARYVLPTCLATKLYMTMTLERWRDFLKLRTSTAAHPDMRVIAKQIQRQLFPDEIGGGNAD